MLDVKASKGAGYLVLVDPDRWSTEEVKLFIEKINVSGADGIMVGSSLILGEGAQRKMKQIQDTATLSVILSQEILTSSPHMLMLFFTYP